MGYNLRRYPAALATEKVIRKGEIGRVQSVLAHVNAGDDWSRHVYHRGYYGDAALSGDVVLTKLTHDTDWIQHILNTHPVECWGVAERTVWSAGDDGRVDGCNSHDICCAAGRFASATVFAFHFTTTGPDYERRFVFNGTMGQVDTILHTGRPGVPSASVALWLYGGKPKKIRLPESGHGHGHGGADERVLRDFLRWLDQGPTTPFDPESILGGMIIPTAALESARTGKRVDCETRLRKARQIPQHM